MDGKLGLLCKAFLRDLRTKWLFVCEVVSPDHRMRNGKSNASAETSPFGDPSRGSLVSAASNSFTSRALFVL